MTEFSIDNVQKAAYVLSPIVRRTPLNHSVYLSTQNKVYLKAENLQLTGSFKLRGAFYKIATLLHEDKARGVIACSAGNHAQGVALAARRNGTKATIFIPSIAPISKIEATRSYGADVRLIDGVYDDAYAAALKFQQATGGVFIHPFDDIDVISGQGTIALEILEQLDDVDAVVVPIGGGGLISGIAATIKTLKPECRVYGVQPQNLPSMYTSFACNQRTKLDYSYTFADGTAVKLPGELTFKLCQKYVDDVIVVSENEIASAILALMEHEKTIAEGAGALAVAACLSNKISLTNKKIVCVVSGGNIDMHTLSSVVTNALKYNHRLCTLNVTLLDSPGQLRDFSAIISQEGGNIVEMDRNYDLEDIAMNSCSLRFLIETRDLEHFENIKTALIDNGYNINVK